MTNSSAIFYVTILFLRSSDTLNISVLLLRRYILCKKFLLLIRCQPKQLLTMYWFNLFKPIIISYGYHSTFSLGNGRWDWELQAENVCYEATGEKYGVIKLKQRGLLAGIKLEHVSGNLACQVSIPQRTTLWGCTSIVAKQHEPKVSTVVTDNANRVVFPANFIKTYHFDVPGFNPNTSNVLVFTNLGSPNFFKKGQELRIWYTEDLYSRTTHDNGGVHCINVYAKFWIKLFKKIFLRILTRTKKYLWKYYIRVNSTNIFVPMCRKMTLRCLKKDISVSGKRTDFLEKHDFLMPLHFYVYFYLS